MARRKCVGPPCDTVPVSSPASSLMDRTASLTFAPSPFRQCAEASTQIPGRRRIFGCPAGRLAQPVVRRPGCRVILASRGSGSPAVVLDGSARRAVAVLASRLWHPRAFLTSPDYHPAPMSCCPFGEPFVWPVSLHERGRKSFGAHSSPTLRGTVAVGSSSPVSSRFPIRQATRIFSLGRCARRLR